MPNQLKKPLIYLISDGAMTDENVAADMQTFLSLVQAAVQTKISLIQIREKQLSARNLFQLTQQTVAVTRRSETRVLVNDRADIAAAANADGVHLTINSLAPHIVRQTFGENFMIGVSTHSAAEIERAELAATNFAVFSPIFATPSKIKFGAPQGLNVLREVCQKYENFPIIALGGIDETNFQSALDAGAKGVAAIRWLNDAENLPQIVKTILHE